MLRGIVCAVGCVLARTFPPKTRACKHALYDFLHAQ
jgi:hypothetical protein